MVFRAVITIIPTPQIRTGSDIQSVTPCVGHIGAEPARKVSAEGDSEAVVDGIGVGKNIECFCEQTRNGSPWLDGSSWVGSRRGLIASRAIDQMCAFTTHISHLDAGTGPHSALAREVPLLHIAIGKIRLQARVTHTGRVET